MVHHAVLVSILPDSFYLSYQYIFRRTVWISQWCGVDTFNQNRKDIEERHQTPYTT